VNEPVQNDCNYLATLAGGLAHEVRNPLNAMELNLQLMIEELAAIEDEHGGRLRRRAALIRDEVRRLDRILQEFLNYTRGPELQRAPLAVNDLLERTLEVIAIQAGQQNVRVMKSFASDLPVVPLDGGVLQQALLNLCLNALQAMPQGGDLIVRTQRQNRSLRIDIIDTGIGIPDESAARVFQAYYSTRKGGSGLGLALARRYVEAHNGTIAFASVPGQGTDFTVLLPLPGEGAS